MKITGFLDDFKSTFFFSFFARRSSKVILHHGRSLVFSKGVQTRPKPESDFQLPMVAADISN